MVDVDPELRDAYLLLDLEVGHARDLRQPVAQALGEASQGIEVVAVDLHRDLGPDAREHVVEPVRDRLPDV